MEDKKKKKWNAPEVAELDVKNTENGSPCLFKEVTINFPCIDVTITTPGHVDVEEGNGNTGDDDFGHLDNGTTATS